MSDPKLRLLVLSAGTLSAQNVIDALGPRRERCLLIGTNSVAEAAGNFRCDIAYVVPPAASGAAYIERIAELIREERPRLVIPTRDDDILALATLGERSPSLNVVLLTGSVAAARLWDDKVETARFAMRHGLPFAPTAERLVEALEFARAYGLPLIGKPRCGNATRGVVLLRSAEEIERAFAANADLIAQPFLDPPAETQELIAPYEAGLPFFFSFPDDSHYSVQVVVGPDGALSEPFACVSTIVGGQTTHTRRCDDGSLLEIGRAYARAAAAEGWKGPLNMQFKRTADHGFLAFELNGRFSGGTAARDLLGSNEIAETIRRFAPDADFPSAPLCEADLVQKYLRSYPIPRDAVEALNTTGKWLRPVAASRV